MLLYLLKSLKSKRFVSIKYITYDLEKSPPLIFCGNDNFILFIRYEDS